MATNDEIQRSLQQILNEIQYSRRGLEAQEEILREYGKDISALELSINRLQSLADNFSAHIRDAEEARKERIAFDKRLIVVEGSLFAFSNREKERAELEKEDRKERRERQEEADKERRESKRVFIYFVISQVLSIGLALLALFNSRK